LSVTFKLLLTFLCHPTSTSSMSNFLDSLYAARFPQGKPRWSSGYSGAPASSRRPSRPDTIPIRDDATRTGPEADRYTMRTAASSHPSRQGANPSAQPKFSTRSNQPTRSTRQSEGQPNPQDYVIEEHHQDDRSGVTRHSAVTADEAQSGRLTEANLRALEARSNSMSGSKGYGAR
jgi:hypothetical protein